MDCQETVLGMDQGFAPQKTKKRVKNFIGFWILGLCNNYAYVIMLTAAFDLLKESYHSDKHSDANETNVTARGCNVSSNANETNVTARGCNVISTGAILLADIIPSLCVKLVAPFLAIRTNVRVLIAVCLSAVSFIITSLSTYHWMTFVGVICAALSSGLGEVTFLSFSSFFEKDVVSAWSSGTGGAGVVGAFSYASLTHALHVRVTLQIMLIIPVLMAIAFWIIIEHPPSTRLSCQISSCTGELDPMLNDSVDICETFEKKYKPYTLKQKFHLVKPLLKYMIPLGIVYFAEYFINQGLMELAYFPNASKWLNHDEQYRWYQVVYQIGVLISRSSVNLFQMKKLWLLSILQIINAVFMLFEAYYLFLPSIWIVFVLILYEGLLGGCAYVNTFYRIAQEVPEEHKEFSMGVASLGDATGITLAGIVAMPVHDALCQLPL